MSDEDSGSERPWPPGSSKRLGKTGLVGADSIEYEDVPEDLRSNPNYWLGRYIELEKAYMDLGQQIEQLQQQQKTRDFFNRTDSEKDDIEQLYLRGRNLIGIFTGVLVILHLIEAEALFNLSPLILVGAAVAITTILDAISLPELLSKFWEKIPFPK